MNPVLWGRQSGAAETVTENINGVLRQKIYGEIGGSSHIEESRRFWNLKQKGRPLNISEDGANRPKIDEESLQLYRQQLDISNQFLHQQNGFETNAQSKRPGSDSKSSSWLKNPIEWSTRIGGLLPTRQNGKTPNSKQSLFTSMSKIDDLFISRSQSAAINNAQDGISLYEYPRRVIHMQQSFPGMASNLALPRLPLCSNNIPDNSFNVDVLSRVLIPNNQIGAVIGKGGAIIKFIREYSGARVTITDAGEDSSFLGTSQSNGERMIYIAGSFMSVCSAFGAILAHAETPSEGKPLPNMSYFIKTGVMSGASVTALDEQVKIASSCFRLLIPSSKAGALIGVQGNTINQIRDSSGAHIEISSNLTGSSASNTPQNSNVPDRIVKIAGSFTSCVRAHYLIMLCLIDPSAVSITHLNQIPAPFPSDNKSAYYQEHRNSLPGHVGPATSRPNIYNPVPNVKLRSMPRPVSFDDYPKRIDSVNIVPLSTPGSLRSVPGENSLTSMGSYTDTHCDSWHLPADQNGSHRHKSQNLRSLDSSNGNLHHSLGRSLSSEVFNEVKPLASSRNLFSPNGIISHPSFDSHQVCSSNRKLGASPGDADPFLPISRSATFSHSYYDEGILSQSFSTLDIHFPASTCG